MTPPDRLEARMACRCCGVASAEPGEPHDYCTDCSVECVPLPDDDPDWDGECRGRRYCDEEGCTIRHG